MTHYTRLLVILISVQLLFEYQSSIHGWFASGAFVFSFALPIRGTIISYKSRVRLVFWLGDFIISSVTLKLLHIKKGFQSSCTVLLERAKQFAVPLCYSCSRNSLDKTNSYNNLFHKQPQRFLTMKRKSGNISCTKVRAHTGRHSKLTTKM